MANRYLAGASGLPFAVLRDYYVAWDAISRDRSAFSP
jgi:hypothetical protein